ncbi:hypothetical protein QBC35DRAFT_501796 [Podospora australis]|uniref:Uncharacterized protein n=1 Tax=Podospora australis TaxID=1536484 RepID=A0AAN6WQF3_9PEZI|nr:hypothetical protein QBC35DRAFT_501796 [Podospora australis]
MMVIQFIWPVCVPCICAFTLKNISPILYLGSPIRSTAVFFRCLVFLLPPLLYLALRCPILVNMWLAIYGVTVEERERESPRRSEISRDIAPKHGLVRTENPRMTQMPFEWQVRCGAGL